MWALCSATALWAHSAELKTNAYFLCSSLVSSLDWAPCQAEPLTLTVFALNACFPTFAALYPQLVNSNCAFCILLHCAIWNNWKEHFAAQLKFHLIIIWWVCLHSKKKPLFRLIGPLSPHVTCHMFAFDFCLSVSTTNQPDTTLSRPHWQQGKARSKTSGFFQCFLQFETSVAGLTLACCVLVLLHSSHWLFTFLLCWAQTHTRFVSAWSCKASQTLVCSSRYRNILWFYIYVHFSYTAYEYTLLYKSIHWSLLVVQCWAQW